MVQGLPKKNYQVWYHRRWLITEIAEQIKAGRMENFGNSSNSKDERIQELGQQELDHHLDVMQVNDDYKNYNGWSHRQFIAAKFGLWSNELIFVEDLIRDDVRNNSAWNHRYTIIKQTRWPLTDENRRREIDYAMKNLRLCANNESGWIYLAAFLGQGEGKVPWLSIPEVEVFVKEALDASGADPQRVCRFAVEAQARIHDERGERDEAIGRYNQLKFVDKIRANYWEWRASQVARAANAGA